ncbi:MAG: serine hydrolase, partial [Longimicrobiales bacterium]
GGEPRQHLLVVTEAPDAIQGLLYRMERGRDMELPGDPPGDSWRQAGPPVPVVVGRSGVGPKKEGDGRSPQGMFSLGPAFGYAPEPPAGVEFPFRAMAPASVCVDDTASAFYDLVFDADTLSGAKDWDSAEAMRRDLAHGDDLYQLGVMVRYNADRVPGAGSCIFLHLWRGPGSPTAGCTAMAEDDLLEILRWLDPGADPLLVQGHRGFLEELRAEKRLPYPVPAPTAPPWQVLQPNQVPATATWHALQTPEWDGAVSAFSRRLAADVARDSVGGIAAGIVVDGDLVWAGGFGWSDREAEIPMAPGAVSRTGSISKSVTAMVLMRLVDAGVVELDDPVERYLPEFASVSRPSPGGEAVTLRHLASHTAGLEREPANVEEMVAGPIGLWEDRVVESLENTAFDSLPGARYQYSNIGFGALGLALSRAAGVPFFELVREEVFHPLGMTGSSFVVVGGELEPRLARGYANRRDGTIDAETPAREHAGRGYKVPNGGVYSTVADLGRFLGAVAGVPGLEILSDSSRREMISVQTPEAEDRGYGIGLSITVDENGARIVGHGGSVSGYTAHMAVNPESRIGVVLLRNYGRGATNLGQAASGLVTRLSALPTPPRLSPASENQDRILADALVEGIAMGIPGLSVAIGRGDALLWQGTDGYSDVMGRTPVESRHRFGVGSITKTFVARVILQLVEEGKLDLEKTPADYLDLDLVEKIPNTDTATLRHLLNHQSGIPTWEFQEDWIPRGRGRELTPGYVWGKAETLEYCTEDLLPATNRPGERYSYSNTNYTLLGLVIEAVTGNDASGEIRRRILEPLGLEDTFLESFEDVPGGYVHHYHYATPHFRQVAGVHPSFREMGKYLVESTSGNLSPEWTAGGMVSSAPDLVRWARAIRDGELLGPAMQEEVFTYHPPEAGGSGRARYMQGISRTGGFYQDYAAYGHSGGTLGFTAYMYWLEGTDIIVVLLANVGGMHSALSPSPVSLFFREVWMPAVMRYLGR